MHVRVKAFPAAPVAAVQPKQRFRYDMAASPHPESVSVPRGSTPKASSRPAPGRTSCGIPRALGLVSSPRPDSHATHTRRRAPPRQRLPVGSIWRWSIGRQRVTTKQWSQNSLRLLRHIGLGWNAKEIRAGMSPAKWSRDGSRPGLGADAGRSGTAPLPGWCMFEVVIRSIGRWVLGLSCVRGSRAGGAVGLTIRVTFPTVRALGMRVEVPSALPIIDAFAADPNFPSIGSSDLIRYLIAMDRKQREGDRPVPQCHAAMLRSRHLVASPSITARTCRCAAT